MGRGAESARDGARADRRGRRRQRPHGRRRLWSSGHRRAPRNSSPGWSVYPAPVRRARRLRRVHRRAGRWRRRINLPDPENIGPLLLAVINMRFDAAAALIQRGENPNHIDFWGRAPAVARQSTSTPHSTQQPAGSARARQDDAALQVVEQLLEAEADPECALTLPPPFRNVGNNGRLNSLLTTGATPLLRAAKALDAPVNAECFWRRARADDEEALAASRR